MYVYYMYMCIYIYIYIYTHMYGLRRRSYLRTQRLNALRRAYFGGFGAEQCDEVSTTINNNIIIVIISITIFIFIICMVVILIITYFINSCCVSDQCDEVGLRHSCPCPCPRQFV